MVEFQAELTIRAERSGRNGTLDEMVERFPRNMGALPYRFAVRVRTYARAKAPVRTGLLKSSIERTKVGERAHRVTVGAYYGVYVNYGTRYMRAQPFWEPAIRQARMELRRDMRRVLTDD